MALDAWIWRSINVYNLFAHFSCFSRSLHNCTWKMTSFPQVHGWTTLVHLRQPTVGRWMAWFYNRCLHAIDGGGGKHLKQQMERRSLRLSKMLWYDPGWCGCLFHKGLGLCNLLHLRSRDEMESDSYLPGKVGGISDSRFVEKLMLNGKNPWWLTCNHQAR